MNIKKIATTFALILIAFALISGVAAEVGYCCERTTTGAWCQNQPQENCDSNYKIAPTSCDSTSYCKPGCCFDSQEGLCMENTPQRVCEDSEGTWDKSTSCEIPQCGLGCCVLGDQGAFVTLTRCKQISGFYGILTDFRRNIGDELSCIAAAQAEDVGACVYEDPASATKTCKFQLRKDCKTSGESTEFNITQNTSATASVGFYKDTLCTAEELGTDCAPSTKTMLIDGRDEVYWQDTCGNRGNIYDASKYSDKSYWKKIVKKEDSCGAGSSNARSTSCGNCDYYLGSIGKEAGRATGFPTYGDYICLSLDCKSAGKKHGESWCVSDSPTGNGLDTVGSRYFKEVCIYGEVLTEPCADYRNERCIEGKFGSFSEAACRVNRWQDCTSQEEKEDCENPDQRDCHWFSGYYFSQTSKQIEKSNNDTGKGALTPTGLCLPNYPPGFNFWSSSATGTGSFKTSNNSFGTGAVSTSSGSASTDLCTQGNAQVTIQWKRIEHPAAIIPLPGLPDRKGDWECANDECERYIQNPEDAKITDEEAEAWAKDMNKICYQLGDCGGYKNFIGISTNEGYSAYLNNKRIAGAGGSEILEAAEKQTTAVASSEKTATTPAFTGSFIRDFIKSMGEN